jgi:hypothetical protein
VITKIIFCYAVYLSRTHTYIINAYRNDEFIYEISAYIKQGLKRKPRRK